MAVSIQASLRSRTTLRRPLVMGILNVTPDSFSDGGLYLDPGAAAARAEQMIAEGAGVIDIGGESTRPGAAAVRLAEELRRTIPVIRRLAKIVRVPLSIDTSKADVAERAMDVGASIINDVTALRGDPRMAAVAARSRARVILMHMAGTPRTMQKRPRYHDVVSDVAAFLTRQAKLAQASGITRERILVDPGLGFGKTMAHNLALMRALPRFVAMGYPVVIGPSRKSFIGQTLDADVNDRLPGTLACAASAFWDGAHMVRVHDVKACAQLLQMLEVIRGPHAAWREH